MGYYSDPTAAMALGSINREFSRLERKAKRLRRQFLNGEISAEQLVKAQDQFTGIYSHVLEHVLAEEDDG